MNAGIYCFIIVGGVLQAMGSAMNVQLYKPLQNPWLASLVSFSLIVAFFVAAFAVVHKPLPTAEQIMQMPWWAPLAGVIGAVAVYAGLVLVGKVGAGPYPGLNVTAALLPFLRARLEEVAPAAAQAGVSLDLAPAPAAEARWHFDEKSLARAVENLLLNALQHSPPSGRVTLGAEVSPDRCRLLVRDAGPGVPAAERIFEPFVTTRAEGVGLGLSLVREIAEAHGGAARLLPPVDGTPGAAFALEIPSQTSGKEK